MIKYDSWTILPLRQNDIYMMDAVDDLGLMLSQLKQINACQMYLQITTLTEMMDHTSMHLLPQVLKTCDQAHPQGSKPLAILLYSGPKCAILPPSPGTFGHEPSAHYSQVQPQDQVTQSPWKLET